MGVFVFAIPGDLAQRTGGYGYDRRVLQELGPVLDLRHLALPGRYPLEPDLEAADARFAALSDGTTVLVDGLAYGVLASVVRRHRQRLGFVALCHHPLALETGLDAASSGRLRAGETEALALARAVVVTSPATADTLAADYGVPRSSITVAIPGTDPQPTAPCSGDPPVILTLATLTRRKGHDVLIEALARIAALSWRADFVGSADLDPDWTMALRDRIARTSVADRIRLLGAVDDATPVLAGADLFVLPSRYEGYGMAFAEAMAHGLPIVAARAGAVPDVVPPTAGLLVPPDDPAALAEAIASLLTDRAMFERYRAGSKAAGAALPGWAETARIIRQVMERVAA